MTQKKDLSERDICTQYILPALVKAGWDIETQIREEVFFTDAIECRSPGSEQGHVRIDAKGIHLDPTKPAIDSGVMITLKFYCEEAHVFTYEFHFNQGTTYFKRQMTELPDDCDCSLRTIWRD